MAHLDPSFYLGPTVQVARGLLGQTLVRKLGPTELRLTIVETEAYLGADDPACHAARGKTPRNQVMFQAGGVFYVYSIHSRFCLNVVTEEAGVGAAVLVRAVEPQTFHALLHQNRSRVTRRTALTTTELTNGPGKLCEALSIDMQFNGAAIANSESLWIESGLELPEDEINVSGRIGIREGSELPLRFFVDGNIYVSGKASLHKVKRVRRLHSN